MDRLTDWSRQTQTQTHRDADTDTQRHTHTQRQRQTDGRTDGGTDGRTDRQGENRLYATVLKAPKPRFGFQGFDMCFFTLNPVVMILLIQHLARRVMLLNFVRIMNFLWARTMKRNPNLFQLIHPQPLTTPWYPSSTTEHLVIRE